jgi:CDP-diacylglycerol--glycerol-3-phosphate 3-phosphatidyltransferase
LLIPVFLGLTIPDATWTRLLAAFIFIVACATDPLDGYFARARNEVTDFGAIMDPLADKLLVMTAFVVLVKYQTVAAWIAVIIIGRELIITALRSFLVQQQGKVLSANRWGKFKTLAQMIGGSFLLVMSPFGDRDVTISLHMPLVSNIVMAIILVATVWSGFIYVRDFLTSQQDHPFKM